MRDDEPRCEAHGRTGCCEEVAIKYLGVPEGQEETPPPLPIVGGQLTVQIVGFPRAAAERHGLGDAPVVYVASGLSVTETIEALREVAHGLEAGLTRHAESLLDEA